MITYTITTEQFDKTNKALSDVLGMNYSYLHFKDEKYVCSNRGYGGIGTLGYKYTADQRKNISNGRKGIPNWNKGGTYLSKGPHTSDSKQKMSESCKNRPKSSCLLCKKVISGQSNLIQHYKFNH